MTALLINKQYVKVLHKCYSYLISYNIIIMKIIIEIRGGSGGAESKLLVLEQFGIYSKTAKLHNL